MAVFTGRNGKVSYSTSYTGTYTDMTDVLEWTLEPEVEGKDYCSSSTLGRRKRVAGNGDATGTVTIQAQDGSSPPFAEGDTGAFRLYENATKYHQLEVYIESISPTVNIDDADIVGYEISWSGNGLYAKPA